MNTSIRTVSGFLGREFLTSPLAVVDAAFASVFDDEASAERAAVAARDAFPDVVTAPAPRWNGAKRCYE